MSEYLKPLPNITPHSKPFWDAAKEHRLLLPRCIHCKTVHMYFEPWCNACSKVGIEWQTLSGYGHIWANCRFHKSYFPGFQSFLPYNVAIVQLDEGPKMMTNIVNLHDGTLNEMPIGMRVKTFFEDVTNEITLIKFESA